MVNSILISTGPEKSRGILLSENSNFASIILNKFEGIRAAVVHDAFIVKMIREV